MLFEDFPTKTVTLGDSGYPKTLSLIPNPPKSLYFRGNLHSGLVEKCLGIVGSRRISSYGTAVLEYLFDGFAPGCFATVSGFMRGVDITAHTLSVNRQIPTLAVLPCGLEETFPNSTMHLYQKILESGGAVLSEYSKNEKPQNWMFVKRNRIIAGLCSALLIIEAGKSSGSLITYEYAKKYGKKILTVPGDIFREGQQGICQILREGATPVFSGFDINVEMGVASLQKINAVSQMLDPTEVKIVNSVGSDPSNLNDLARKTNISISALSTYMTNLQLGGLIKEIKGIFYAVKG